MSSTIMEQPDRKRIGNQEVFDILDEITKLKEFRADLIQYNQSLCARTDYLERDNQTLRTRTDCLERDNQTLRTQVSALSESQSALWQSQHAIRMRAIQDRRIRRRGLKSKNRDLATVRAGNNAAHGGDILADMCVLVKLYGTHVSLFDEYQLDFWHVYQVTLVEACAKLSVYRPKLVELFNIVGTVSEVFIWDKLDKERNDILALAKTIIDAVSTSPNTDEVEGSLGSNTELGHLFARIRGIFWSITYPPTENREAGEGEVAGRTLLCRKP
ncbi:hypothetical protein FQN54_001351 [Arachnomyces sp. PD_36]|nr:hypothetical protein FQN54_001351 [Arachnomyces sp. PD_36]